MQGFRTLYRVSAPPREDMIRQSWGILLHESFLATCLVMGILECEVAVRHEQMAKKACSAGGGWQGVSRCRALTAP